ncbi:hypothetical protein SUGI_0324130 [Cryptomeria japonica]|nr:hypothetical protein SUGI_0324130 [Cryptomeria japonica]
MESNDMETILHAITSELESDIVGADLSVSQWEGKIQEDGEEDLQGENQEDPGSEGCSDGKEDFMIDLSMEISAEKALWEDFAVIARVIGPKLSRVEINNWVSKNWGEDTVVKYIPKGFFVVIFAQESKRCRILNQENWFVNGNPIYIQHWSSNFNPIPLAVYDSPVWIRLYNLSIEYWDDVVLEKIGQVNGGNKLRLKKPSLIALDVAVAFIRWRTAKCSSEEKEAAQSSQAVILKNTLNKEVGEPVTNEEIITFPLELPLKIQAMKDDNLSKDGHLEAGHDSNGCVISSKVEKFTYKPFFKGLSDTEVEYDLGMEEDFKSVDELDNVDQRCINQSGNALLGKAKGVRGRRSNRQVREARDNKKGIVSVIHFMKNAKGGSVSLGEP